ncbi:hypothetical protein D3C83_04110 [compost metagenome]
MNELFSDGRAIREQRARGRCTEHREWRPGVVVGSRGKPAGHERQAERFEVAGHDVPLGDASRAAVDGDAGVRAAAVERRAVCGPGRCDARDAADALEERGVVDALRRGIRVHGHDFHRHDRAGIEADVD